MSEHSGEESSHVPQRRTEAFLDCIAHLLAKRRLRDQREQEKMPHEKRSPCKEGV